MKLFHEAVLSTNLTSGVPLDTEFDYTLATRDFPKVVHVMMRGQAGMR